MFLEGTQILLLPLKVPWEDMLVICVIFSHLVYMEHLQFCFWIPNIYRRVFFLLLALLRKIFISNSVTVPSLNRNNKTVVYGTKPEN